MIEYAPIALFLFNRPEHTKKTLKALKKNIGIKQTKIYVFCDGPRKDFLKEDNRKINIIYHYIERIDWCKELIIEKKDINFGLANNIILGISKVLEKHESIIVLEDDLVSSKGFVNYMNTCLLLYKEEEKVMHISGYFPPISNKLDDTFFYNSASCWGWGTWKRAWNKLLTNPNEIKTKLEEEGLIEQFNVHPNSGFLHDLDENISGNLKTWAIKWHASVILSKGLCLHPKKTLIRNIGMDNSGVHCNNNWKLHHQKITKRIKVVKIALKENPNIKRIITEYYKNGKDVSIFDKIVWKINKFLKR